MLKTKNKLTILHDDNSSFTDYSNKSLDYGRDSYQISLSASEDYLYVGFYKPINVVYIDLITPNTNSGTFAGEFYNGTTWASLVGYLDETDSLMRSGFIQWDRNQTDESKTTVNYSELYWYRFRPTATHTTTEINGVNIVFADDNDLKKEFFEISEFLPSTQESHILTHSAARDHIIQDIRNSGHYKESLSTGRLKDITAFDLLDLGQIKVAATYLALSKIFNNVIDDVDDRYKQKASHYMSMYEKAMNMFYLNIDKDDDGISDYEEELASATTKLLRR